MPGENPPVGAAVLCAGKARGSALRADWPAQTPMAAKYKVRLPDENYSQTNYSFANHAGNSAHARGGSLTTEKTSEPLMRNNYQKYHTKRLLYFENCILCGGFLGKIHGRRCVAGQRNYSRPRPSGGTWKGIDSTDVCHVGF